MKLFIFILSVYFTALSAMPCADGEIASLTSKESSHNEKSSHLDLCSPFCTCACCGVHILNYTPAAPFAVKAQVFSSFEKTSLYKSTFISNYRQSIWQPPQLS